MRWIFYEKFTMKIMLFLPTGFSLPIFVAYFLLFCALAVASNKPIPSDMNEVCRCCQQSATCHLPNSSCCIHQITGVPAKSRPQIVYVSFDDAVTMKNSLLYERIFNPSRINPNGCPISMTLFVSNENTNYSLVKSVYKHGHEIAVQGYTPVYPKKNKPSMGFEAIHQRRTISERTNIPLNEIIGFRALYSELNSNSHYEMLFRNGFKYDSSLTFTKKTLNDSAIFPFTLAYSWPYQCLVPRCPSVQSFKDLWEFPIISLVNTLTTFPCVYEGGCLNDLQNEKETMAYLWTNFDSYYSGSRAPFGLNMISTWLFSAYDKKDPFRLRALELFLDRILSLGDVYVVSIKKTMQWMEQQPLLNEIESFTEWQCEKSKRRDSNEGKAVLKNYSSYQNKRKAQNNHQIMTNEDNRIQSDFSNHADFLGKDDAVDFKVFRSLNKLSRINKVSEHRRNAIWLPRNNHFKNVGIIGQEQQKWMVKAGRRPRYIQNKSTRFNLRKAFLKNNSSLSFINEIYIRNKTVANQHILQYDNTNTNTNTAKNTSYDKERISKKKLSDNKVNVAKNNPRKNLNDLYNYMGLNLQNVSQTKDTTQTHIINKQVLNGNISASGDSIDKCFQGTNCKRPNCWCIDSDPELPPKKIPHLIYVTFSGVISEITRRKIGYLFSGERTNPNGCNIRSTVFVTSQNSSYGAIHWLHRRGHEIALNGLADGDIDPELRPLQIPIQKRLLKDYAGIPEIDIRGWRNPKISFEEGEHLKYVKKYNLDYDASLGLIETQHQASGHWPFTLDFGRGNECSSSVTCQEHNYSGLWEVPLTHFVDMNSTSRCLYIERCHSQPITALETYDFLVTNFLRAYTVKKPLGINLRSDWFQDKQQENFRGLEAFINLLVELPDVYIIRISDLIHWIQYPRPIKVGFGLPGLGC